MREPLKVIIVGAGFRAMRYSEYALTHPDKMKIVGVAEVSEIRRKAAQDKFGIPDEMCFASAEELAKQEKLADAIINGTQDTDHVPTAIPLLKKGYDMLLEKPFAVNEEEMKELANVAEEAGVKVMICHVLRYAPFYRKIKELIESGELGDIYHIHMTEHIAFHHMISSFVRGPWPSEEECGSSLLLAKSCHDVDMMMWLMGDVKPKSVYSTGTCFKFGKEKKPANAGTRCVVDCPIEKDCPYSAKRNYVSPEHNRWAFYVWAENEKEGANIVDGMNFTDAEKIENLKTSSFGRCVWDIDRGSNIENQTVVFNFENGATGTFNLIGGTPGAQRYIHVIGTKGEVRGVFDHQTYQIKKPMPESYRGHILEDVDLKITGDMTGATGGHGGGDSRLVEDFVAYVQGGEPSISCTELRQSVVGHLAVFRAEKARKEGKVLMVFDGE